VSRISFDELESEEYPLLGVHGVQGEVVFAVAKEPLGLPGVACVFLWKRHFDPGSSCCWLCCSGEVWDDGLEGLDELVHAWDDLLSLGG
jgi:hypothetical protein